MVDSLQLSNPLDLLHNKKRQRDEIDQNPNSKICFPSPAKSRSRIFTTKKRHNIYWKQRCIDRCMGNWVHMRTFKLTLDFEEEGSDWEN